MLWIGALWLQASAGAGAAEGSVGGVLMIAASVVVGLAAGLLCMLRWRMSGETRVLWIGCAIALFAGATVGVAGLLPAASGLGSGKTALLSSLRVASLIVVLVLLVRGLTAPVVDSRLRPRTVLPPAIGVIAALTLALQLVLPDAVGSAADPRRQAYVLGAISLGLVVAWLTMAAAYWIAGVRDDRRLLLWMSLTLLALALCELLWFASASTHPLSPGARGLLQAGALSFALIGAVRELQWAFAEQSGRLLDSMAAAMTVQEQLRAREEMQEERAHEARNALTAIEGATKTLERYHDMLDEGARVSLESAISAEVSRLQRLIAPEAVEQEPAPFDIAQTLAPLITVERLAGSRIDCEIPDGILGMGRQADIAEIVQNLLVNARRYAPEAAITVAVERQRSDLVIAVEDDGPGVAEHQREAIFARGARGEQAVGRPGSGLGLFISAQLARAQGGDLWVDERAGGGASFKLRLPAAESSISENVTGGRREQPIKNRHHFSEAVKLDGFLAGRRAHRAHSHVAGSVGQTDDDLGAEIGGRST